MKTRITTIVALLAIAFTLSAQKGNVSSADYELTLDKPDLEKAEAKILEAEKNEKTASYPKTYIVKQRVYRKMFFKDNTNIDALFVAENAIKKAQELDIKGDAKGKKQGKFKEEIKKDLLMLRIDFQNAGANAYNAKDFDVAMKCFEKMLELDQYPYNLEEGQTEAVMDTAILFNTAIAAYSSENKEKTKKYMLQCIDYGYGESTPHTVMYMQYREEKDSVEMIEILKDGFNKYPEDATFLRELVLYFINTNNLSEGMKYINIALESDPSNSSFWFTKGTFHDQANEKEEALVAYKKALETAVEETDIYNVNYNLAVIYYNEAVEAANAADEFALTDLEKSTEMSKAAKETFRVCIPYFEACLEIKPQDLETLKALRPVYYRLSEDEAINKKYEELLEKIKVLEEL